MAKSDTKGKPGKRLKLKGGGATGSIKELKKSLKRGKGGGYLKRVPADGITVRFLQEPDEWYKFFEHYDEGREDDRYFPCVEGDCEGCDMSLSSSKRYLVNALDVSDNRVVPLVLPASLASNLLKKYDKFGTITDRDYELTKDGTGFDTEYDALYDGPTKLKIDRYKDQMHDLEGALLTILDRANGAGDDDEDDDEPKGKSKSGAKSKGKSKSKAPEPDDDDDDEDDEPPARTKKAGKPGKPSKAVTKPKAGAKKPPAKKALPKKKSLGKK